MKGRDQAYYGSTDVWTRATAWRSCQRNWITLPIMGSSCLPHHHHMAETCLCTDKITLIHAEICGAPGKKASLWRRLKECDFYWNKNTAHHCWIRWWLAGQSPNIMAIFTQKSYSYSELDSTDFFSWSMNWVRKLKKTAVFFFFHNWFEDFCLFFAVDWGHKPRRTY